MTFRHNTLTPMHIAYTIIYATMHNFRTVYCDASQFRKERKSNMAGSYEEKKHGKEVEWLGHTKRERTVVLIYRASLNHNFINR